MKSGSGVIFKTPCSLKKENVHNIMYIYSTKTITEVFLSQGKSFVVNQSLIELEKFLPTDFFHRVNRQMIVNLNFVKSISINHINQALLENGIKFNISRRRKKVFIEKMMNFK